MGFGLADHVLEFVFFVIFMVLEAQTVNISDDPFLNSAPIENCTRPESFTHMSLNVGLKFNISDNKQIFWCISEKEKNPIKPRNIN